MDVGIEAQNDSYSYKELFCIAIFTKSSRNSVAKKCIQGLINPLQNRSQLTSSESASSAKIWLIWFEI